jgi:hypothetical protein
MSQKVKLTPEDWNSLLPETAYSLGNTKLQLRPMTITEIAKIARIIQNSMELFKEKQITIANYMSPENVSLIVDILATTAPDIISDCAGLDIDDVKALPYDYMLKLVVALIEVNLQSKDSLEKNLTALTTAIQSLTVVVGK